MGLQFNSNNPYSLNEKSKNNCSEFNLKGSSLNYLIFKTYDNLGLEYYYLGDFENAAFYHDKLYKTG